MSAPRIESKIAIDGEEFRTRSAHNRALAEKLRADVATAALGGTGKSRERHVSRGKLLPRERGKERPRDGVPRALTDLSTFFKASSKIDAVQILAFPVIAK